MIALLGDGWFYVSAAGFIISAVFFVFLLGQYREAVEAEDDGEEPVEASEPVRFAPLSAATVEKLYVPKVSAAAVEAAPDVPAPAPAPAPIPAPAPVKPSAKENTTGALSPAVVYLQNMKVQMERLDKDIAGLKAIASEQSGHTDLVLKKLAELSEKVGAIADVQRALAEGAFGGPAAASAPASVAAPQPEPAPAPEPEAAAPQPEPAAPEPKPEPAPLQTIDIVEPARAADPDKTLIIEPTVKPAKLGGSDVPLPVRPGFEEPKSESPASEPAAGSTIELLPPAGGSDAPVEAPKPARKGPVWPI